MTTEALTTQNALVLLLADKSNIGTTDARFYLASRMRTRTPAGAAEYLKVRQTHDPEAWDARVKLSLDLMGIYRTMFPRHYNASHSPHYSTAREHELYRLVNLHLFPLCISEDRKRTELESLIENDPNFFLPYIPVEGTQQHNWLEGCCGFERLQTVFKLALVLMQHPLARRHREAFLNSYGLNASQVAPPLGAYGWTHFRYYAAVGGTWLKYLPLAFHMISYKTGSPWLDIPPGADGVGFEWGLHNIAMLFKARRSAEEINANVLDFDHWLVATGRVGVVLSVQMWNDAAELEAEQGFTGMRVEDLVDFLPVHQARTRRA